MKLICPVCKKEFENFSLEDFGMRPKTTLYGNFRIMDMNGDIVETDRRTRQTVCSEACKSRLDNPFLFVPY